MKFDPLISVKLNHASREYQPGDLLECEYQVDAVDRDALKSVEVATMWFTSGKGDEEEAIHYYERQTTRNTNGEVDLRELSHFSTELPLSPLSYAGTNLNITWCVRVRIVVQARDQSPKEFKYSQPFQLHAYQST